jgi:hypothetical protein
MMPTVATHTAVAHRQGPCPRCETLIEVGHQIVQVAITLAHGAATTRWAHLACAGTPELPAPAEVGVRPAKRPRAGEPPEVVGTAGEAAAAAPEDWVASIGGRTGRRYVPVGALVVPARMTQPIKVALETLDWVKKGFTRIHKYAGVFGADKQPRVAVHVSPVAAAAFDAAAAAAAASAAAAVHQEGGSWSTVLPPQLAALASQLQSGEVRWHSGLRVGDELAEGGLGSQWHLSSSDLKRLAAKAMPEPGGTGATAPAAEAEGGKGGAQFRFIELFAGIGGFRFALEQVGGTCVWASEIGEEERQTYFQNFGEYPSSDITECPAAGVPSYAMLTAGFPCQSFCQAGLKTGFNDARGELFFEVVRMARKHEPATLLLENVPHLVEIDDGTALQTILHELECLGYRCCHRVLSSRNVVPQDRHRLYIVCFRDAARAAKFVWPAQLTAPLEEVTPKPPTIRDILEPEEAIPAEYTVPDAAWAKLCAREKGPRLADRDGAARARSHCRFVLLRIHFIPD